MVVPRADASGDEVADEVAGGVGRPGLPVAEGWEGMVVEVVA